jgi:hypothetical protein
MADLVLPRVQAMILCDDLIESDEESDVFHLAGVRAVVEASSFPTVHSLYVFVQMSGHHGEATGHVVIASESGAVIGETERQTITFEDPTIVVPVVFRFADCVFAMPGLYYVEMYNERKLIGERRLTVRTEE